MKVSLMAYTALSVAASITAGWYALSQTEGEAIETVPLSLKELHGVEWEDHVGWDPHPLREGETFSTLNSLVEQWDTEDGVLHAFLSSQFFLLVRIFFSFFFFLSLLFFFCFLKKHFFFFFFLYSVW